MSDYLNAREAAIAMLRGDCVGVAGWAWPATGVSPSLWSGRTDPCNT